MKRIPANLKNGTFARRSIVALLLLVLGTAANNPYNSGGNKKSAVKPTMPNIARHSGSSITI